MLATRGGLCHNHFVIRERWYSTGLLIALLAVSVSILLVRWNTMLQRVPLVPLPPVMETATAAGLTQPRPDSPVQLPAPDTTELTLDLNTACAAEFDNLPGIGPVLAGRIISARDARGGFDSVDDLLSVEGIGQSKLDAIRELVKVSPAAAD